MRISALTYVPRLGRRPVGVIGRFRVSVSIDGRHFRQVAHGRWRNVTAAKTVRFTLTSARYVRLTALSHAGGSSKAPYAAHAIKLLGKPSPSVIAPKPPGGLAEPAEHALQGASTYPPTRRWSAAGARRSGCR